MYGFLQADLKKSRKRESIWCLESLRNQRGLHKLFSGLPLLQNLVQRKYLMWWTKDAQSCVIFHIFCTLPLQFEMQEQLLYWKEDMEDSHESYEIFSELPLQADLKTVWSWRQKTGFKWIYNFWPATEKFSIMRQTVDLVRKLKLPLEADLENGW